MGFDLKLMVGGAQHKVVLDESGFRGYCVDGDWGLKFPSVAVYVAFAFPENFEMKQRRTVR